MNRRQAIQQLSIMGLGLALYPACNVEEVPVYTRIPLDAKSYRLFQQVSEAILPVDHLTYVTPEPRSEFILTILNDCTASGEIEKYLTGLKSLQNYLAENKQPALDEMSGDQLDDIFAYMAMSKDGDEHLFHFYNTTRNLALQHFTGCEKFMTEELKYEFIPARYIGCASI